MANQQGWNQQTPAVQSMLRTAMGGVRRTVKRASSKVRKVASKVRRTVKKAKRGKARLVKGSAAAKRYMASIRKLRK